MKYAFSEMCVQRESGKRYAQELVLTDYKGKLSLDRLKFVELLGIA